MWTPDNPLEMLIGVFPFLTGWLTWRVLMQRSIIHGLQRTVVRERAQYLELKNARAEQPPSEVWLFRKGLQLVSSGVWRDVQRSLKRLEHDAEWCKAHMHEFQIGAAIEQACRDLPEGLEIRVDLENGAGTATLKTPDGMEWRSLDNENFAAEIGACVVKATNWKAEKADKWSPEEVALFVERGEKPLTLNRIGEVEGD